MHIKITKIQTHKIKEALFTSPYRYYALISGISFLFLNFALNEVYVIGFHIFSYVWYISIPYTLFTVVNTILIALNVNLMIMRFKEMNGFNKKGGVFSAIGTTFALLTGACPGCIAGIFPAVAGILGSTFTLNQLPLYGMEIQILSTVLLLIGTYQLSKPMTCKIKI